MRGQTHSSTFRLPTFIRSQRNLVRESKKRRGDTKSNSEIPTQTGSELGRLNLRPKACDESTLHGLRPRNAVVGTNRPASGRVVGNSEAIRGHSEFAHRVSGLAPP